MRLNNTATRILVNMPSILKSAEKVEKFPNLYISPFGNDGVIPLYSSIPLNLTNNNGECLPCVACGNSITRQQIIAQQSLAFRQLQDNNISVAVGT